MVIITLKYFLGLVLSVDIKAVIDIFKLKNINNAVVFHCNEKYGMSYQKVYQSQNLRVQTVDISRNISYIMHPAKFKIGMVINTSCNLWDTVFHDVNEYKNQYSWIIYTENLKLIVDTLSQHSVEIDTNVMIMVKQENIYQIHEVFHSGLTNGNQLIVRNIGYWDSYLHITINNRYQLNGVILKYAVVSIENIEHETFRHFVEYSDLGRFEVDSVHKFKFFTMLKYVRDMYNFSYRLQRTNSWGYLHNGSYDGLVGALQRGDADVGGSGVFIRADRARFIDYVAEIWPTKPQFVFRQPKFSGGFYSIYTGPLANTVWYCLMGILFAIAVSLVLILKQKIIMAEGEEEDNASTLSFLFIFSALSQQGMSIKRNSNAIKIIMFITFIFTLTLYQFYNALVLSALLKEPPRTIKNLKDLLHSKLEAGVEDVAYNKDYFKHTTDPIAIALFNTKIVTKTRINYLKTDHGLSLVKRGGFAYLVDTAIAYNYMRKRFSETEICDTQEVPLYPPQSLGIVVRKGLPYKEHFAYAIRKMLESGVMYRLKTMWDEPRPPCVRTPDASVFSVNIYEFSMALVLLLGGAVASILILFCEIIMHKHQSPKFPFQH